MYCPATQARFTAAVNLTRRVADLLAAHQFTATPLDRPQIGVQLRSPSSLTPPQRLQWTLAVLPVMNEVGQVNPRLVLQASGAARWQSDRVTLPATADTADRMVQAVLSQQQSLLTMHPLTSALPVAVGL